MGSWYMFSLTMLIFLDITSVVSGDLSEDRDWAEIWKSSDACKIAASDLEELKSANKDKTSNTEEEKDECE